MNDKEKPGQDAEVFVKAVKRKTRKYFSAEEKIRIVLEGMKRDVSVAELCRREGIPSAAYYSWTKDFMEGGKAQLQAVKNFFLRAGYTTQTSITGGSGFDAARGLTMGLGLRNEKWRLDYAVLPSGELGRSHRFSFGARF